MCIKVLFSNIYNWKFMLFSEAVNKFLVTFIQNKNFRFWTTIKYGVFRNLLIKFESLSPLGGGIAIDELFVSIYIAGFNPLLFQKQNRYSLLWLTSKIWNYGDVFQEIRTPDVKSPTYIFILFQKLNTAWEVSRNSIFLRRRE